MTGEPPTYGQIETFVLANYKKHRNNPLDLIFEGRKLGPQPSASIDGRAGAVILNELRIKLGIVASRELVKSHVAKALGRIRAHCTFCKPRGVHLFSFGAVAAPPAYGLLLKRTIARALGDDLAEAVAAAGDLWWRVEATEEVAHSDCSSYSLNVFDNPSLQTIVRSITLDDAPAARINLSFSGPIYIEKNADQSSFWIRCRCVNHFVELLKHQRLKLKEPSQVIFIGGVGNILI